MPNVDVMPIFSPGFQTLITAKLAARMLKTVNLSYVHMNDTSAMAKIAQAPYPNWEYYILNCNSEADKNNTSKVNTRCSVSWS